jgi:hypothetical protein
LIRTKNEGGLTHKNLFDFEFYLFFWWGDIRKWLSFDMKTDSIGTRETHRSS